MMKNSRSILSYLSTLVTLLTSSINIAKAHFLDVYHKEPSRNRQEEDDDNDLYKAKTSYPFVDGLGQVQDYQENRDMVWSGDNLKKIIRSLVSS